MAVGIRYGGRAATRSTQVSAPNDLAGLHFQADWKPLVVFVPRVDVVTDQDQTAVMVLKGFATKKLDFVGIHAVTGPDQF